MKKNFLNISGTLLFSFLLFSGCGKQINEQVVTTEQQTESQILQNNKDKSKCRLVTLDWSEGGAGLWQYGYNNNGLADTWTIDYGDGAINEVIYYNENGRMIRADEDYFGSNYVYRFYYTHNRLTRLTRTSVEFPDQGMDFQYTYNNKGENIRQDDYINDEHVLMYYDAMGNCTKTDIYLGSDLWFSDNYTFSSAVKNPWLYVPGVETGFLSYGGTYPSNKRFFTSNRSVLYDTDGTSYVLNDYDPSQTVIQTGSHNLPISARYYDRVTESPLTITFDYDNCGGGNDNANHAVNSPDQKINAYANNNIKNQVWRIYRGRIEDKKEKIAELIRQVQK